MSESPIVSTAWLAAHLNDPDLRIVDIRGLVKPATEPPPHYFNKRDDYEQSHIPGAVFIDWVEEITHPNDPNHALIAPPERYAAVMGRAGVDADTFVVAYDDGSGIFAARLWWTLNVYGHTRAAVLDGGWAKWTAEGRPTTTEKPDITPTTFTPQFNPVLRRTADEVQARLHTDTLLIDVRTPGEYNGEASRIDRFGHIPGAVNSHRAPLLNEDGTLRPPEALRAHFASVGVKDDAQDVVFYCNAGVSASFSLLALRAAGFSNGAVYDGSWKDWGSDVNRPVE